MISVDKYNEAISFFPSNIKKELLQLKEELRTKVTEIRIRKNKCITLISDNNTIFYAGNSRFTYIYNSDLPVIKEDCISDIFHRLCNYSVYSYSNDIANGFITIKGGHRVGIAGTAIVENGKIVSVRDISSLNIRIAKEIKNAGDEILNIFKKYGIGNLLIAGPPSSGKTTMLRDVARRISSGELGKSYKISVIDERREIFSSSDSFDSGYNTDILLSYPKDKGIQIALRTLSPDFIFTDEIGTDSETDAIISGLNSGVRFMLSIHCSSFEELMKKRIFNELISCTDFPYVVLLSGNCNPGTIKGIKSSEELI